MPKAPDLGPLVADIATIVLNHCKYIAVLARCYPFQYKRWQVRASRCHRNNVITISYKNSGIIITADSTTRGSIVQSSSFCGFTCISIIKNSVYILCMYLGSHRKSFVWRVLSCCLPRVFGAGMLAIAFNVSSNGTGDGFFVEFNKITAPIILNNWFDSA